MKRLLFLLVTFLSFFSQSYAEKKICTIPSPINNHCIVTDDEIWGAHLYSISDSKAPFYNCWKINGFSQIYPACYNFFFLNSINKFDAKKSAERFLKDYGQNHSMSFSSVELKEENVDSCIYKGAFFGKESSKYKEGIFYLYVFMEKSDLAGMMFVKLYSLDMEEEETDAISHEAFNLITPIYSPKY